MTVSQQKMTAKKYTIKKEHQIRMISERRTRIMAAENSAYR